MDGCPLVETFSKSGGRTGAKGLALGCGLSWVLGWFVWVGHVMGVDQ